MAGVQGSALPTGSMPVMQGEEMHLHDAVQYWESTQAALAHAGLLKAAMGMEPDEASKIVDIDLSTSYLNSLPIIQASSDDSRLACA